MRYYLVKTLFTRYHHLPISIPYWESKKPPSRLVAQKVHGQVRYGELWIIHSSPVPGTPWVSDAGKQERSMGLESKTHEWTSKLGEPMLATSPPHWCGLSLPRKTESLWKSYDTNLVSRMTPLSVAAHIFINCSRPLSSRWMCSDSGPTTICPQPLESPCCWEVSDMYKPTQSALLSTLLTPTALCHYSNTVVYKLAKKTDGKSWKCVNVWMDEICRQPIATLRPPLRQLSLGVCPQRLDLPHESGLQTLAASCWSCGCGGHIHCLILGLRVRRIRNCPAASFCADPRGCQCRLESGMNSSWEWKQ